MFVSLDPVRATHLKYAFRYALELMETELGRVERQVVYLHCGLAGNGRSIGFGKIAEWFSLPSASAAEAEYVRAVVKLRAAIPGSRLENWISAYRRAYKPLSRADFRVDPYMPVPVWDGREPLSAAAAIESEESLCAI